jgi:hypothetical protein
MAKFFEKIEKQIKQKVALGAKSIQNSIIDSEADKIQKERAELITKGMAKQRSLEGQLKVDQKYTTPGSWVQAKNADGTPIMDGKKPVMIQLEGSWANPADGQKQFKTMEQIEELNNAMEACWNHELVENATAEQEEAFYKKDVAIWETLKKLVNSGDKQ